MSSEAGVYDMTGADEIPRDPAAYIPGQFDHTSTLNPVSKMKSEDNLHFKDGVRRIDMVLVFKDTDDNNEDEQDHEDEDEEGMRLSKKEKRETFEENLKKKGLELEYDSVAKISGDEEAVTFVKVHVPWKVLSKYAEVMNMKMPIMIEDEEESGGFKAGLSNFRHKLFTWFHYDEDHIPPEPNFFTAGFMPEREDKFIIKDRDHFFTPAQRSLIAWQILRRTEYHPHDPNKQGIVRLMNGNVYMAAYPLHDGPFEATTDDDGNQVYNERRLLRNEWAKFGRWYKFQPLWLIKRYFGDKIGLYFAWLGFYTNMLILPAIFGILISIYGLATMYSSENYPSDEICDEAIAGGKIMCPNCEKYCPFWKFVDSCPLSRLTYLIDNWASVAFAVFMSFWATMFLELWKRNQAVISWEWDLTNFEEEEQTRPEYEASIKTKRVNPVTKKTEPYLPTWNKGLRVTFTYSFVLLMLFLVICVVAAIELYRIIVRATVYQTTRATGNDFLYSNAKLFTSLSAATLNLIAIMILNKIYGYIAYWLTNLECPRTQTDFEDSYTFKVYLFQCINFYSSLAYIAFFKGKFYTHPGDDHGRGSDLGRFRGDLCDPAGCMYELGIQLGIIMVGKQVFNNLVEILLPILTVYWKKMTSKIDDAYHDSNAGKTQPRWQQDYFLTDNDRLALLDEYLEMVIQYGFVTLFVAAFPLAPFFALANNIIEIRLDAYKLVTQKRRPLGQRAQDIGAWFGILQAITYISIATNAITIALASDFVPKLVYLFGYNTDDGTLKGYVNFTLAAFNTSDWGDPSADGYQGPDDPGPDAPDDGICYFKAFREGSPDYKLNLTYFHVFASRLAFVLVFEHVVLGFTGLVSVLIPDVPVDVKVQIQRERLLEREILYETSDSQLKMDKTTRRSISKGRESGEDRKSSTLTQRRPYSGGGFDGAVLLPGSAEGTQNGDLTIEDEDSQYKSRTFF